MACGQLVRPLLPHCWVILTSRESQIKITVGLFCRNKVTIPKGFGFFGGAQRTFISQHSFEKATAKEEEVILPWGMQLILVGRTLPGPVRGTLSARPLPGCQKVPYFGQCAATEQKHPHMAALGGVLISTNTKMEFLKKRLHSKCQQIWKNSAVATGLEKVSFHSSPKEGQCQRMFKLPDNCTDFIC